MIFSRVVRTTIYPLGIVVLPRIIGDIRIVVFVTEKIELLQMTPTSEIHRVSSSPIPWKLLPYNARQNLEDFCIDDSAYNINFR